jgi:hypothetical protein
MCHIKDLKLEAYSVLTRPTETTFYIQPVIQLTTKDGNITYRDEKVPITIPAYSLRATSTYTVPIADFTSRTCANTLQEYVTY